MNLKTKRNEDISFGKLLCSGIGTWMSQNDHEKKVFLFGGSKNIVSSKKKV